MEIEMLAAKNGDCLLLHYTTPSGPGLVLIDGGPAGVWEASLKPRLMGLRDERGLADNQPLVINLLIISHVDDDHINGVLNLLRSMHERRENGQAPQFRIERIWHNSFDNILDNDETLQVLKKGGSQFGPASTDADVDTVLRDAAPGSERDTAFVLASIQQGDDVRRLAGALGIDLNPDFGRTLIETGAKKKAVKLGDLELIVAGPLHDDLKALQTKHDDWLKKHPERQKDAKAILAALDDKSVANLSSIVLLARSGGKTLLLTGDARLDKVVKGLEISGVLDPGESLDLDILKMPHHGSIRNIDGPSLARLPARRYLFSGNGKYFNPDRETFELLLETRPGAKMDFVLSYKLRELDEQRKKEAEKDGKTWNAGATGLTPVLSPAPGGVKVIESPGVSVKVKA